jgi:hypothetical protein
MGLALWLALTLPASAQQRPLVTEDPETIGAGLMLAEAGLDYSWDMVYPASGLTGNLLRVPTVGLSLGVSSIAEIQIDTGFYNRLSITQRVDAPLSDMLNFTGDKTSDFENIVVGTKVRLASEGPRRPAIGIRFATQLPTASNESGLGLDTMDFHFTLLVGKTVQSVRVVGNVGFGILSDPTRGDRQNDVFLYGVSFARALTQAAELVGEVNGRLHTAAFDPPPGTESRATMRLGARYTVGPGRVDGGILLGMTSRDPSFGVMAGFTYVFNAFRVP